MNSRLQRRFSRGLSLIELLVVMAVISCLVAMVLFSLINVRGHSQTAKSRHNARNFCSLYQAARSVGATFTAKTKEGILEELIEGKNGRGQFSSVQFQMTLAGKEKEAALAYCTFDPVADVMIYRHDSH